MNSRIVVFTNAYNAERTLQRAIESVLNQTYENFIYLLIDNGSTDSTGKIIQEYAEKDHRIVPLYNEVNGVSSSETSFYSIAENISEGSFLCVMDADDEYYPYFFERALDFAVGNNLDIVAGGNEFIDVQHGNRVVRQRSLAEDLIISGDRFVENFQTYHMFLRTSWGKLFSKRCLTGIKEFIDKYEDTFSAYGSDTASCYYSFSLANRIGIMSGVCYKYYVSPKSSSYSFHPSRIRSDQKLHELAVEYLSKYGPLGRKNQDFLYEVYFDAICETISVVFLAQIDVMTKLSSIQDIVSCTTFQEMMACQEVNRQNKYRFKRSLSYWLIKQHEHRESPYVNIIMDIFGVINPKFDRLISSEDLPWLFLELPELITYLIVEDYSTALDCLKSWYRRGNSDVAFLAKLELSLLKELNRSDIEILRLLVHIRQGRQTAATELNIDELLAGMLSAHSYLQGISIDFAVEHTDVVACIMLGDYRKALEVICNKIDDNQILERDEENAIRLGRLLSAILEESEVYVYFSKLWIRLLIVNSQYERADQELADFESILPADEDLISLREHLSHCLH